MDQVTNPLDGRHGTAAGAPAGQVVLARSQQFLALVFAYMTLAPLVTALAAWVTASSETLLRIVFGSRIAWLGLVVAQFGGAIALMRFAGSMSSSMAVAAFTLYAGLTGMLFSSILLVFTGESIVSVFVTSAGMFAATGIFGAVTRRSLAGWTTFLLMGLVGTIIVSVVNVWLQSPMVNFVLGLAGVVTFAGLTAWDVQRLRRMGEAVPDEAFLTEAMRGALSLYLDFINMFLSLLRLMGRRR